MDKSKIGKVFAKANYSDGIPEIGKRRIVIMLAANPNSLTLLQISNNMPLLSIPWSNIREIRAGFAEKNTVENLVGFVMSSLLFIPESRFTDDSLPAFFLSYWDDDVQRERQVLISTHTEDRRDEIMNKIWLFRDEFHRNVKRSSIPRKR